MSNEWFTVCYENDILLEKNEINDYKISLDINENPENEFTSKDIISEGQLFDLLFELNKDLIHSIDENILDNNINTIALVLLTKEQKKKNIYLKYKVEIQDNTCILNGIPFEDKNEANDNDIYIDNFSIKLVKDVITSVCIIIYSNKFLDENNFD